MTVHHLYALVEPPDPLTIPPVPPRARFDPSCISALVHAGWVVLGATAAHMVMGALVTVRADGSWSVEAADWIIRDRAADPAAAAREACRIALRIVPATREG